MSKKGCKSNKSVCVYQREKVIYLNLQGVAYPSGEDKKVTINQTYIVTAEEVDDSDVLVVRADRDGAVEHQFDGGVLVTVPDVLPCPRNNPCKQVTKYHEVSAFIDVGSDDTRQLQEFDGIAARDGEVMYIPNMSCGEPNSSVNELISEADLEHEDYPRAESFRIHLKSCDRNA